MASESNQNFYNVVSEYILITTVTYCSMVAAWIVDQKNAGSNLLIFLLLLFYFKSEGYGFKSSEQ